MCCIRINQLQAVWSSNRITQQSRYEDKDAAEIAENKISGPHRLASERDGTEITYNLFGIPSWNNFYMLEMFELINLKVIIERKKKKKTMIN